MNALPSASITLSIDSTPGRIAVVMERLGQRVRYPCACVMEAEILLRAEKRRLGLPL